MRGVRTTGAMALLLLLPLGLFGRSIGHDFVDLDDKMNTERFGDWHGSTREKYVQIWTTSYVRQFTPVTGTVVELLRSVAARSPRRGSSTIPGVDPLPFHAAALALHVANGLLVWGILRRLVGHEAGSLLGALVFVLHPAQVEAFAWVGDTNTVLGGFFFLAALLLWLVHDARATDRRGVVTWYTAATAAFVLGVLAKPTTVVLPLVLYVVGRFCLDRRPARLARDMAPWAAVAVPIMAATAYLQRGETLSFAVGPVDRVLVALDAIAFYVTSLVDMGARAVDYGRSPAAVVASPLVRLEALAVASAIGAVVFATRRRAPAATASLGVFLAGLLPVLGLKPFLFQTVSTVADRYLYLPLVGVAIGMVAAVRAWPRLAGGAALVAVLACGGAAARQLDVWRNSERLFTNTVRVNSRSWLAWNDLAAHYEKRGRRREAIDAYLQSLVLFFRVGTAQRAARLLVEEHEPARAAELLRHAVETDPTNASVSNDLASVLLVMGRRDEAAALERRTVVAQPAMPEPDAR